MKNKKRMASLLLAGCMAISAMPVAFAANAEQPAVVSDEANVRSTMSFKDDDIRLSFLAGFSDEVVYMYNVGLPNDRPLSLDEQMLYDDILKDIFKDEAEEYGPFIVLHQTKMYENFIFKRQFDVKDKYYKFLKSADKKELSLADRIAITLPARLAYFPIAMKKRNK